MIQLDYVANLSELADEPALVYFRATPRFETADGLTRHIFVCDGVCDNVGRPNRVQLTFLQVL